MNWQLFYQAAFAKSLNRKPCKPCLAAAKKANLAACTTLRRRGKQTLRLAPPCGGEERKANLAACATLRRQRKQTLRLAKQNFEPSSRDANQTHDQYSCATNYHAFRGMEQDANPNPSESVWFLYDTCLRSRHISQKAVHNVEGGFHANNNKKTAVSTSVRLQTFPAPG